MRGVKNTEAAFWSRAGISRPTPEDPRCWLWTGKIESNGYGRFWFEGKWTMAHRFSYEHLIGPIPEGLVLDHLCRVTHCVNPHHLEPVPQRVNVDRGSLPGSTFNRGEGHGARKLDLQAVTAIREGYVSGLYSQRELADRYGVDPSLISRITSGLLWKVAL